MGPLSQTVSMVSPGDLNDVRSQLADNLEGVLDEEQRAALRRAIPDDVLEQYREAGETTDEQEALAEAAAEGIDEEYINYYETRPDIREALSTAAQGAFGDSDREAISELAQEVDLDEVYAACSRGNFSEVADIANLDSSNFDSVNECKNVAANAQGYSQRLFNAYRESDSQESFTARDLDE